jgi:hypothetical protein
MTITVKSRKQKARKLQQWIAKNVSKLLGVPVKKDGDIESRPMGMSGVDVILRGEALKRFPFSTEAKSCENWSVHSWMRQAKENLIDNTDWLLFCKRNFEDPVVILDANVFFKIYEFALKGGYVIDKDNKELS